MSSAEAPSAAVRTMMPPPFASRSLTMSLSRVRSVLLEPARDAVALPVRHVDEEAARERDLGRQPRALRLHRVLDGLDEDRLPALDQVLDPARALPALELGADDLVDVQEAVLLEPDLDERGLHPGEDVVDDAEVDVPRDRAALGALEVHLGDAIVLEDRDALLADVDRDEQLALRRRQRRPARRRLRRLDARAGLRSVFRSCSRASARCVHVRAPSPASRQRRPPRPRQQQPQPAHPASSSSATAASPAAALLLRGLRGFFRRLRGLVRRYLRRRSYFRCLFLLGRGRIRGRRPSASFRSETNVVPR